MNNSPYRHFTLIYLALAVVFLTLGCARTQTKQTAPPKEKPPPLALQFANIPIPDGFSLDREKTFIYESGSGSVKVGRLYFSVWNKVEDVVEYFRNEMPPKGWTSIRIIEHQVTVMLYETETELCTVIVEPSIGKTKIEIQVGPK